MGKDISPTDLDDFPLSPTGSVDAVDFYKSFLATINLAEGLTKKELGVDSSRAVYNLLQEVHLARTSAPALLRARPDANTGLTMLWLSRVREKAQLFVALNNLPDFKGLTSEDLSAFSKLSRDTSNLPRLASILLERGVVLIYERAIPGIKLDGAVFALDSNRPVIALSLRYPRLDIFWFTLLHELAHVVLHSERIIVPILDDLMFDDIEHKDKDIIEMAADRLASNSLINRSDWRSCKAIYSRSEADVNQFAEQVGVHPSIVAGRIQRELGRHDIFSPIINEVNVRKVLLHE